MHILKTKKQNHWQCCWGGQGRMIGISVRPISAVHRLLPLPHSLQYLFPLCSALRRNLSMHSKGGECSFSSAWLLQCVLKIEFSILVLKHCVCVCVFFPHSFLAHFSRSGTVLFTLAAGGNSKRGIRMDLVGAGRLASLGWPAWRS